MHVQIPNFALFLPPCVIIIIIINWRTESLAVNNNFLSGLIPDMFGQLERLDFFDASNNLWLCGCDRWKQLGLVLYEYARSTPLV